MKVLLATNDFEHYFRAVYPDLEVYRVGVAGRRFPNWEGDLLIFTGGEDINPRMYGQNPNGTHYWNEERDNIEENIFYLSLEGTIKVNKVLGVCRGHQILNALSGGSLTQDLGAVNKSHRGSHNIKWEPGVSELLTCLKQVNSLHHQAIRTVGSSRRYKILGTEPTTKVIESIMWSRGGGKWDTLGVQFHPEFFSKDLRDGFFSAINKWVDGEELIKSEKVSTKSAKNKYMDMTGSVREIEAATRDTSDVIGSWRTVLSTDTSRDEEEDEV